MKTTGCGGAIVLRMIWHAVNTAAVEDRESTSLLPPPCSHHMRLPSFQTQFHRGLALRFKISLPRLPSQRLFHTRDWWAQAFLTSFNTETTERKKGKSPGMPKLWATMAATARRMSARGTAS